MNEYHVKIEGLNKTVMDMTSSKQKLQMEAQEVKCDIFVLRETSEQLTFHIQLSVQIITTVFELPVFFG